jgi:regulator of protease activity HflC (stomatin/prohibitin superfamily)
MAILVVFFIFDRFRSVNEGEVMVIERFGAFLKDDSGAVRIFEPGRMYFLWPAPIDKPVVLRASESKEIDLNTAFWPRVSLEQAANSESLPPTDDLDPLLDGYNLTGDLNILHTRWKIKYRITNYYDYLTATRGADPTPLLSSIVRNAVIRHVAGISVDDAYYGDHRALFARINDTAQEELEKMKLGISIDGSITNQSLLPPGPAQGAFNQVTSSLSERKKLVDDARKEASATARTAETEALNIENDALQYKAAVVADAKANAGRIRELQARFTNDAAGLQLYLTQYRYDRLLEALSSARVYVLRPSDKNVFWLAPLADYLSNDGAKTN